MQRKRYGVIISNGVHLEKHEFDTVAVLVEQGWDVELIPPSYTKGQHTADIIMGGMEWEMKSPNGKSVRTIEHIFRRAVRQSGNIVIDLRRIGIPFPAAMEKVEREFEHRRNIRRLKVIALDGEVLDFKR